MSNKSPKWVEFPEVAEQTEGQIIIGHTGLPQGLDPDRLQLNVRALDRGVIGWGGYSALVLAGYSGDKDQYGFQAGTDASGNAYAVGAASIAKAKSADSVSHSQEMLNALDIRNGVLGIKWNTTALNDRLEIVDQYDPAIRAKQLDSAIRGQAIKSVALHNTKEAIDSRRKIINGIQMGIDGFTASTIVMNLAAKDYTNVASTLGWRFGLLQGFDRSFTSMAFGVPYKQTISDAFLFSVRPSRIAVASGVLATNKLVRPTPVKS